MEHLVESVAYVRPEHLNRHDPTLAQPGVQSEYVLRVGHAAWVARVLDRGQFAALGAMGGFHGDT